MLTLRQITEQFPHLMDSPVAVLDNNGEYHYAGASCLLYEDIAENEPVLILSAN